MLLAVSSPDIALLFASAGLVIYAASRAAVDSLTATSDPLPGRMAFGQWMPIAWACILPTIAGHSEIGIGLAFATSVAMLSLNLGVLLILAPAQESPAMRSRAWPFVLPATFLLLLAGFSGSLTILHALMLLLLGVAILIVWRGGHQTAQTASTPVPVKPFRPIGLAQLLLAIALGAVGAWLGYQGVMAAVAKSRIATSGLISAAILGPLLALPILGTGTIAAQNGRVGAVIDNLVGIVLLNLCLLVPLVILTDYARNAVVLLHSGALGIAPMLDQLRPVPFPLGVWRLDCVLVMALGLLLLPVSLGRWALGRSEGLALAFGYVAYLIASAALAIRL